MNTYLRLQSAALEAIANAVVITDAEAVIQWANPAFSALTGYALDEVIGKRPQDLVKSGLQSQEFYRALWQTINGGTVWRGEVVNRRKDGTLYIEALTITPVLDEASKATHFIAVKEDITRRKRLEQRQLAHLRLLEQTTGDVPISELLDELVRFIEEQDPTLRCSILLADETAGVLRHGAAPSLPEAYNRLMEGQPIAEGCGSCGTACARREPVIVRDIRKDPLWAQYSSSVEDMSWLQACWSTPFFDSQGRLLGTFGVYAGEPSTPTQEQSELIGYAVAVAGLVVENKQANEALRQSENKLSTILDSVEAYIYIKDTDLRYRYVNRRVCELFGKSRDEIVGLGDEVFFDAATAASLGENDRRVLGRGERVEAEEVNAAQGFGETRTYLSIKLPLRDDQGRINALCGISTDITERRRLEDELRETDERLRMAARAGNVGLWDWDLLTNRVFYSAEWKSQIGYEDHEIGDDFSEWKSRVHPDDLERMLRTIQRYLDNPYPDYKTEFRFQHKKGDYRWILTQASLVYGEQGKPVRMLGSHIDITERKRAEEARGESEERLQIFIEHAPASLAMFDREMRYLAVSRRWMSDYGLDEKDDITGQNHYDVFPEIPDRWKAIHRRGLSGEVVKAEEDRFERSDGRVQWLRWEVRPWYAATGTVGGIVIFTEDITERKRAENELQASEKRLRDLIDGLGPSMFVGLMTHDGTLIEVNRPALEAAGLQAEDVLGKPLEETYWWAYSIKVQQWLRSVVLEAAKGKSYRCDTRVRVADNSFIDIDFSLHPLRNDKGKVVFLIPSANDITDRKQAEAHLRNLNRIYSLLSHINEVIVRQRDPDTLFHEVCRIAVEVGGFCMAWIGLPDPDSGKLQPVARAGVCRDFLDNVCIDVDSDDGSGGPTGTAFRKARYVCCNDIEHDPQMKRWRARALDLGYRASIAMPIKVRGEVRGVYNLYADQPDFFTAEEIRLLDELAGDIGFAMEVAETEAQRRRSEERLRQAAAVIASTREGVMVTDTEQHIITVNRAFTEITGYTEAEVLGRTPSILKSGRHHRDFYATLWASVDATGHWQGEIWNRRKNGEVYPELLSISTVMEKPGKLSGYVGVFADISKLKASEAELEFLAHHDPLTRLPNRLLLLSRLEHGIELAEREGRQLALLMLDLDRFKDINDSYGHPAGDDLLQHVASRLTARLRGADTISRLGGDEFTVLLEDVAHPEDVARLAEEIIHTLNEPWQLPNRVEVRLGVSIGISMFPRHGRSASELLQHADAALYRAKAEGRGRFKYFSEDLTLAARERIELEARLRRALARDELRVYFQPKVDIASGRITGAEALVRWQDPDEGLIPPGRFIPVAEATGIIGAIGEWVLERCCAQGVCWIESGLPPLTLAVNISPHQFRSGDIAEVVENTLAKTGFPSHCLELELTESALMERQHEAVEMLHRLHALGVRLAIDDFGTGYSSLAYLKRFPLDVLKIDRSFVEDLPDNQDDREIAATIVAMAHTLRLEVLAEGVETEEQLAFLKDQGCDSYQGYLMSPPVPAVAFERFLRERC